MKTNMHKHWKSILDQCEDKDVVYVSEILDNLNISGSTLRRELRNMEDAKLIKRFYGGFSISRKEKEESSYLRKSLENNTIKHNLCKYAASLINDNQMVYIDAGSTLAGIYNYITARNVTIVTPAVSLIEPLGKKNIQCFFLGGFVKENTNCCVGNYTISLIEKLFFDIAFIGTNGIHEKVGFSTTDEQEADLKKAAINNSERAYIVADHTKFGKVFLSKFSDLQDAVIITDNLGDFNAEVAKCIVINKD